MPKLAPNDKEVAGRVFRACISANREMYDIGESVMAAKAGIAVRTFRGKCENPETFTMKEVWSLSKVLKLTPVQAASILLGRPLTSREIKEFILL